MTTFVYTTMTEERRVYLEGICDFCKKRSSTVDKMLANLNGAHEPYYYFACHECKEQACSHWLATTKCLLSFFGTSRISCCHYPYESYWKLRMVDCFPVVHIAPGLITSDTLVEIEDELTGTIEVVRFGTLALFKK